MKTDMADARNEPANSPLGDINTAFHKLYSEQKEKVKKQLDKGEVVIVCRMDNRLLVKRGDELREFKINGDYYHELKALAHTTLAAFFTLVNAPGTSSVERVKRWCEQIRTKHTSSVSSQVVFLTEQLLEQVENDKALTHSAIQWYQQALEPVYAELLMLAAKDEMDMLVRTLNQVKEQYDCTSSNMFLVTLGGHQPRYKELSSMVFTRWFADQYAHIVDTDHYVRYCEGGASLDDAVDLVVTAMTDRNLANSMLGTASGLNQDVLGIVAQKAIDNYWPGSQ